MEASGTERPIRIDLTMTIAGDEILMDFTGTDLQVAAAFNLPTWGQPGHYMMSLALLNYFRTLDPDIPYNSGLIRPVRMELPRGSILNPDPGLAYGVRAATFIRVMDCIMACLAQALPDATPAASSGAIAIVLLSALDHESGERRITVAQPLSGGSGARPRQDGIEGTSFTGGWLRNVPNEVLEGEMPILIEEYGYAIDSAAPGKTRGGSAIRFRFRNLSDATVMTARGLERFRFQPWGYRGGHPGSTAHVVLHAANGGRRDLGQLDLIELEAGASVEFLTPSGGGYGDPLGRSPMTVLADVEAGFISLEAARRDYGVVIRDGEVDAAETDRARRARPPTDTRGFTMGPARAAYEAQWPEESQRAVIGLLMRLPASKRALLRRELEIRVAEEAALGRQLDDARLEELLGTIEHARRA
jgi:N-methylhydantoinase B